MSWLAHFDLHLLLIFTLVLTRVSGLVMTAPIYGTPEVPMQVRAFLAVALAALLTPSQVLVNIPYPYTPIDYLVLIGGELLIGVALGLGIVVLLSGIQLAGLLIGRTGGLALGEAYDPSIAENVPEFSRLLYMVAIAVFVIIGGHRLVMAGLLDTFASIPLGHVSHSPAVNEAFVLLVTQSLSLGLRAAAPVVTALLLATLVMGLISRTMPQLNIMALGFGMNSLLTFGALIFSLGASVWVFQEQVQPAMEILLDSLSVAMRGEWLT